MKVVLNALKIDDEVIEIAKRVDGLFSGAGYSVYATDGLAKKMKRPSSGLDGDLIVAIGGDGTILGTEAALGRETPILGIHKGDVGFLAQVRAGDTEKAIGRMIARDYTIEKKTKLSSAGIDDALNEIAVLSAKPSKIIRLRVCVDGRVYKEFDGDGVIIATPTGSTAYAMSAGGPIVDPDVCGLVIVPVCPYTLAARPLVISDRSRVEVKLLEGAGSVAVDGHAQKRMRIGESITVRKSKRSAEFVRLDEHFYRKLSSLVR